MTDILPALRRFGHVWRPFSALLACLAGIELSLRWIQRPVEPVAGVRVEGRETAMTTKSSAPRLLVVEDEYLIRMLLEDMLDDLGYGVAAAVGTLPEARQFATNGDFNAAILDVNLDGQEIYPVADILAARGLPFVFVTGYGERSLPEPYRGRPALQKPFQAEQLKITLAGILA
jgi:CheY-like chemotaxis protein